MKIKKHFLFMAIMLIAVWGKAQVSDDVMRSPWGMCAHPNRKLEYNNLDKEIALMQAAGVRWVREVFQFSYVCKKKGEFNFDLYDELLDRFQNAGIQMLPILQGYGWEIERSRPELVPLHEHISEWRAFVRATVERYHNRIHHWEIWNEEDGGFWRPGDPDAKQYVKILKAAYNEIHTVDSNATVLVGGLCGFNSDYLAEMYEYGAAEYFDAIAIHPYGRAVDYPEVGKKLDDFRKVMVANGDSGKPLWITEGGASSCISDILEQNPEFLQQLIWFGLRKLNQKDSGKISIAVLDTTEWGMDVRSDWLAGTRSLLPESDVNIVKPSILTPDDYPALIWHGGKTIPEEAVGVLTNYIAGGGLVVTVDSIPFYHIVKKEGVDSGRKRVSASAETHPKFHISYKAWWTDKTIPHSSTLARTNPDLHGDFPAINRCYASRYIGRDNLYPGDRYIPIIQSVDKNGSVIADTVSFYKPVSARGGIIVSIPRLQRNYSESSKANLYQRVYLSYLAEGFERIFLYDMHDDGINKSEKEQNFGIVDFYWQPKASFYAYQSMTSVLGMNPVFVRKIKTANDDIQALIFKSRECDNYILAIWTIGKPVKCELFMADKKARNLLVGNEVSFIVVENKNVMINESKEKQCQ